MPDYAVGVRFKLRELYDITWAVEENIVMLGRSCLFWVRKRPYSEIVALLRQAGATR